MSRGSRRSSSAGDGRVDPPADRGDSSDDRNDPPDDRERVTGGESAGRSGGVRVRLAVRDPPHAPVAEALPDGSVATEVEHVHLGDAVVSEFRTDRAVDAEPVFAADGERVYRIRSPPAEPYPSRSIESLGHPVSDVTVRTSPDRILLTLSLPSADPIDEIVEAVDRFLALGSGLERNHDVSNSHERVVEDWSCFPS